MARMLFLFWLSRAVLVFAIAGAALSGIEWIGKGPTADYATALTWAGIAAVFAASLATYRAYRGSCRT